MRPVSTLNPPIPRSGSAENAIEQPMTFLKDPSRWPLSLYLASFNDANGQTLATAMAASLIMLAPAVLIFRFGQQYLELGIQASGLKE